MSVFYTITHLDSIPNPAHFDGAQGERSLEYSTAVFRFKRLGWSDRILAVIVDGEPNVMEGKSDVRECFPVALRFELESDGTLGKQHMEPLAADLRPGKDVSQVTVMRDSVDQQSVSDQQKTSGKSIPLPSDMKLPKFEIIPCVVVDEVVAGGLAEKAGLRAGDRIIRYGNKDTPDMETLAQLSDNIGSPRAQELIVVRGFKILKISVPAGLLGVKVRNN